MDKEKRKKYEKIAKLTGIIIGLVLVLGISYAVFKTVTLGDKTNEISAGKLDLRIDHEQDEINLENAYPTTEEEGLKRSPYVFDVVNEGTIDAAYDLYIEVDEEISTLTTSVVRYYLTVEEDGEEKIVTSTSRILASEEVIEKEGKKLYKVDRKYINTKKTNKYKLYLWIDYDATVEEAANKRFEARVVIEGEQIYDKNRLVKQIDVSEAGDNSVIAYMYADGRAVLKGKGNIASNLSDTLGYEKEGILENWKKKFIEIGCNEEEVDAITTIEELEEYFNSLSEEKQSYFYASAYKDVLEEMGYDTSKITDMDSLEQYLLEQGLLDEEGNATEKGEEYFTKVEKEINNKYSLEPTAPKEIILEDGITNIPTGLFTGNEEIREVSIPSSVTSIANRAFSGCRGLTKISLPNSVTTIGDTAFSNCPNLTNIKLSNNLTKIGSSAFSHCTALVSIDIPNSVTSIGRNAFQYCTSLTSIELSDSVTSIEMYTINNCPSLRNIIIPDSVTSIGDCAFSNCTNLTNITIPDSVTNIGDSAFSGCTNLLDIKLSNNLTKIGNYAFSRCTALASIDIPNSVTSIGYSAFLECTGIKKLTIDGTKNYSNLDISNLEELVITGKGNMINSNSLPWKNSVSNIQKVTIREGVTSIRNSAFAGCTRLKSIEIPNSMISIGYSVFSNCGNLMKINIPNSVKSIDAYTFQGWTSLQTINIDNTEDFVKSNWPVQWDSGCSAKVNYLRS